MSILIFGTIITSFFVFRLYTDKLTAAERISKIASITKYGLSYLFLFMMVLLALRSLPQGGPSTRNTHETAEPCEFSPAEPVDYRGFSTVKQQSN